MTHIVTVEGQTDNAKGRGTRELCPVAGTQKTAPSLTFLLPLELLAVNRERMDGVSMFLSF